MRGCPDALSVLANPNPPVKACQRSKPALKIGACRDHRRELVGRMRNSDQLGYRNKLELAGGRDERGLFMLGFTRREANGGAPSLAARRSKACGLRGTLSYLQAMTIRRFRLSVRRSVLDKGYRNRALDEPFSISPKSRSEHPFQRAEMYQHRARNRRPRQSTQDQKS